MEPVSTPANAIPTPPPASPVPAVPTSAPEAKKADSLSVTADLFAQAEKELLPPKKPEDKKKDERAHEEKSPTRRFKTHDEAEAAEAQASVKIAELTKQLEEAKKAPPKNPLEEGNDEGGDNGEEIVLTEEELEILWEENPKDARAYERKMSEKKLDEALKPFKDVISRMEEEREIREETQGLSELAQIFDTENGKGQFEKTSALIGDAKFLETLFKENPTVAKIIRPMVKSGDRVSTFEVLLKEAHRYQEKITQKKREQSVPADTGSGVATGRSAASEDLKDADTAGLWASAEADLKIKT